MIELKNIRFSYGEREILHGVDLSLPRGTLTGIIGPNGCGKTTLMRVAARQATPQSGERQLLGRDFSAFGSKEFARTVAYFPQTRPLPDMTVLDLLACARFAHTGLAARLGAADRAALEQALEKTDTAALSERRLVTLSGGERQRVYLALLLAQEASCLLLDEPTAHLDIGQALWLAALLRAEAREKCVAAVLHDLPLALSTCDRLVLMQSGRILSVSTPEALVKSGQLEAVFGVRALPLTENGRVTYAITQI